MKPIDISRRGFVGRLSLAMVGGVLAGFAIPTRAASANVSGSTGQPVIRSSAQASLLMTPPYRVGLAHGPKGAAKFIARRAIIRSGGLPCNIGRTARVVIKPNLTVPAPPGNAICTDIGIVEAVVELLHERGVNDIVVADGSGDDPERQNFQVSGYEEGMARLGVRVVDLNYQPTRLTPVPNGLVYQSLEIPEIILNADAVIDIAKLKTHNEALVTLGAKNLFGVPPASLYNLGGRARQEFHQKGVHKVIHDICSVVPTAYTVIDGVLAMEGNGPIRGTPVEAGLVIAGANLVATDAIGCYLMQIDPREVEHLVYLHQSGFGPLDLDEIEVIGEELKEVSLPFQRPGQGVPPLIPPLTGDKDGSPYIGSK